MFANEPEMAKRWANESCGCGGEDLKDQPPYDDDLAHERLPGGEGTDHDPADFDQSQLMMGIHVELEHTDDIVTAMEIAMDHLSEDPMYYTKLAVMEPQHKEEMPRLTDVYVYQRQAHNVDNEEELDPFDTGVAQPKKNVRFKQPTIYNTDRGV